MAKGKNSFSFNVTNSVTEEDCSVVAFYNWYYDPGVWNYSNGDPGYPPESDVELTSWEMEEGEIRPEWLTDDLVESTFYAQDVPLEDDYEPDFDY
jgi:hypothetical protein